MSGSKRETLLDRSQRLLGRRLSRFQSGSDDDDKDQRREEGKKQPTGRRGQVLQAQRTHRHRTQQYIRELEKEVVRFQDVERELHAQNRHLEASLAKYRAALLENDIPVPQIEPLSAQASPGKQQQQSRSSLLSALSTATSSAGAISPSVASLPEQSAATLRTSSSGGKEASISVDLMSIGTSAAESSTLLPPIPPTLSAATSAMTSTSHSPPHTAASDAAASMDTQMAVDFILRLEEPCRGHVKSQYFYQVSQATHDPSPTPLPVTDSAGSSTAIASPALSPGPGVGEHCGPHHLLTASGPLYAHFLALMQDPSTEPLTAQEDDIERLLQSSLNLQLAGEVTPVQIWSLVKEVARVRLVTVGLLQTLIESLEPYLYCNSFGTVVEQRTAHAVIEKVFSLTL